GQAFDSIGVAGGTFQLFTSDPNGGVGTQVGAGIPATVINVDPCVPGRGVQLRAEVQVPNDSQATFYVVPLVASGARSNAAHSDRLIQVEPPGQAFPFCGQAASTAFVSSNGYITFDSGDTQYDPTIQLFFSHSRVSAMYTDLDFNPAGQ